MTGRHRVVIAGGSLGALATAETLRGDGFDGEIVMVSRERHRPCDRPPLSKQALHDAQWDPAAVLLRGSGEWDALDIDWRAGSTSVALDLERHHVWVDGGAPRWSTTTS